MIPVAEFVVGNSILPAQELEGLWDSIVVEPQLKERLINHCLQAIELRRNLPFHVTALHGLTLLYGPPGTGKTTLARSVGQELAPVVTGHRARLIEINPHGLMSAEHGQSQQAVMELLCDHIPGLAADGTPTIVVLDEVESMSVSRSAASLSANPADVHRSTDAVLTAMDWLTNNHSHIVTVATSNFTESLDEAFISRVDAALKVPSPNAEAIQQILAHTLKEFGNAYPPLVKLSQSPQLSKVVRLLKGADGRRVRKTVTDALSSRRELVADPGLLTVADLVQAASNPPEVVSKENTGAKN